MNKIASLIIILLFFPFNLIKGEENNTIPPDNVSEMIASYAEKVRKEWKIPGLSLAVIEKDSIIISKGFGVKKIGTKDSVTSSTLFQIGSMTKAFTAALMASAVDKGLVSWNDTVKKILPDFDWYDDETEKIILVKDLFTHKTGLVAQVGTYIPNIGYDREDIYQMFKYIKPLYPFREKFAYNNITFIIAAKIIEKVTGKSWEENIRKEIFAPLEMISSFPDVEGYKNAGSNASTAHYFGYKNSKKGGGSIYITPLYGEERALHWVNEIGPAGSISSTADDMIKWVKFHINNGKVIKLVEPDSLLHKKYCIDTSALSQYFPYIGHAEEFMISPYYDTVQVISEKEMKFLHTPAVNVRSDSTMRKDYGYCWYIEQNDRYTVIYHTGTTWGFTGVCGFVPALDLGFAVLCNSEVSEYARLGLMRRIIDLYLPCDSIYKDWSAEGLQKWFKNKKKPQKRSVPCIIKRSNIKPDFTKLTGTYYKKAPFGNAAVTLEKGRLYMKIGKHGWKHRLEHHKGNEFWLRSDGHTFPVFFHNYTDDADAPINFEIDFNYNENFGPWEM